MSSFGECIGSMIVAWSWFNRRSHHSSCIFSFFLHLGRHKLDWIRISKKSKFLVWKKKPARNFSISPAILWQHISSETLYFVDCESAHSTKAKLVSFWSQENFRSFHQLTQSTKKSVSELMVDLAKMTRYIEVSLFLDSWSRSSRNITILIVL